MELTQDLSPPLADATVVVQDASVRDDAGTQNATSPAHATRVDVASAVAAATTAAAQPSADTAEALRLFRSSLLEMVGAPALYPNDSATSGEKRTGWLRRSPTEDLSCASLIAKYVSLWSVLERPENQRFSVQALIGLRMLEEQNFVAASKVFREIEFQTSTPAALSYVMRGVGTFIVGFVGFVVLIAGVAVYLSMALNPEQKLALTRGMNALDSQWVNVVIACIAGMFGGVVSLLLRISEFESTRGRSQMFLKLTGATLPIVGGLFGAFVASLFCARIINISIGQNGFSVWAFIVIGFLSGFSERFSRSFVQLAERRLGGADHATRVSVAANATVSEGEPSARARPSARKRRSEGAARAAG